MRKWTKVAIPIAAAAALIAWYEFRPERLVLNRRVDEAMPVVRGGSAAQPVESGTFYSVVHPTNGTATVYQMEDGSRILRLTSFRTSNGPDVDFARSLPAQTEVTVAGVHYVQEDSPDEIGRAIAGWMLKL